MKNVKESVRRLEAYHVPQGLPKIKLNQNESAGDVPELLKRKILFRLETIGWNRYPNQGAEGLIRGISAYSGHDPEGIMVGNGSNEMIQTVINACCNEGGKIAVIDPGFSVYRRAAAVMNIDVASIPLDSGFRFNTRRIKELAADADLVFIDNPNNPTGARLGLAEIEDIAASISGLLIVDEAYFEFAGETACPLIAAAGNIIIIRTFSKAFSLAGLRLGYLLGPPAIVRELDKARLPFSVGIFQQAAGEVLLEDPQWIRRRTAEVIEERQRMAVELEALKGIRPYPSSTNFILFDSTAVPAGKVWKALFDEGIIIRKFDSPGLENSLRVTIGTKEENAAFFQSLRELTESVES